MMFDLGWLHQFRRTSRLHFQPGRKEQSWLPGAHGHGLDDPVQFTTATEVTPGSECWVQVSSKPMSGLLNSCLVAWCQLRHWMWPGHLYEIILQIFSTHTTLTLDSVEPRYLDNLHIASRGRLKGLPSPSVTKEVAASRGLVSTSVPEVVSALTWDHLRRRPSGRPTDVGGSRVWTRRLPTRLFHAFPKSDQSHGGRVGLLVVIMLGTDNAPLLRYPHLAVSFSRRCLGAQQRHGSDK